MNFLPKPVLLLYQAAGSLGRAILNTPKTEKHLSKTQQYYPYYRYLLGFELGVYLHGWMDDPLSTQPTRKYLAVWLE